MKIEKLPAEEFNIESSKTNGDILDKNSPKENGTSDETVNGNEMTKDSLLEEGSTSLNGKADETSLTNGKSVNDTNTSPVNSPQTYSNLELEDELLSDEMTLRLTDDEEPPDNDQNEPEKSSIDSHDLPLVNPHASTDLDKKNDTNLEQTNIDETDAISEKADDISEINEEDDSKKIEKSEDTSNDVENISSPNKGDEAETPSPNKIDETETPTPNKIDETETNEIDETETENKIDAKETVDDTNEVTIIDSNKDDLETAKKDLEDLLANDETSLVPDKVDDTPAEENENADELVNAIENSTNVEESPTEGEIPPNVKDDDCLLESDEKTSDIPASPSTNEETLEKTICDLQNEIDNSENVQDSTTEESLLKRRLSMSSDDSAEKRSRRDTSDEAISDMDLLTILPNKSPSGDSAMADDPDPVDTPADSPASAVDFMDTDLVKTDSALTETSDDIQPELPDETVSETADNESVKDEELKSCSSLKRAHDSEDDDQDVKKPKFHVGLDVKPPLNKVYVKLESIQQFMRQKKCLTYSDLEELCLQKMCECVNHVSQIGELNKQLKKQEQLIESWRNKYTSLSKQVRDLEVVHHRMLQEVRTKFRDGGRLQDFSPVKITRSVGLQVSLSQMQQRQRYNTDSTNINSSAAAAAAAANAKRKILRSSLPSKLPTSPAPSSPAVKPASPPSITKTVTAKTVQVPGPPPKGIKTILPKVLSGSEVKDVATAAPTSLLGSYLQGNTKPSSTLQPAVSISSSVTSPAATQLAANNTGGRKPPPEPGKVIDLTDEDEGSKTSVAPAPTSAALVTPVPAPAPIPAPAPASTGNIRVMAPHQLNTVASSSASLVNNSPRVAYLVQPQPLLIAANTTANRSANIRPAVMFKQMSQGQNQSVPQRFNIVRPANATGTMTVVNPTSTQTMRPSQPLRLAPTTVTQTVSRSNIMSTRFTPHRHPAALPPMPPDQPHQPRWKAIPPKPSLKISRVREGIVLSWKIINKDLSLCEEIASYQLFAYQETNAPPSTDMWRKVGDVKALALPMACTLTQFTDGNKYHFAVRAVDVKSRVGPFSQPEQISLP